ncbi:MAG TPA: SgcJ/EcaC family oxidoreductase [Candidatus Baltobacteraceae bacterium]|nr:SgcJ/EcaC family oxidoreductase [Candidatus Baltobacteraceae bacterium]
MPYHSWLLTGAMVFAAGVAACSPPQHAAPPETRAGDAAAIRAIDDQVAKDIAAKDVGKLEALYMHDAVIFSPGAPAVVGKNNIDAFIEQRLAGPTEQIVFSNVTVDVARSGDLAEDRGTGQVTIRDSNGKPITQSSEYVLVWKKQADGSWKIAADTFARDK